MRGDAHALPALQRRRARTCQCSPCTRAQPSRVEVAEHLAGRADHLLAAAHDRRAGAPCSSQPSTRMRKPALAAATPAMSA